MSLKEFPSTCSILVTTFFYEWFKKIQKMIIVEVESVSEELIRISNSRMLLKLKRTLPHKEEAI